MAPASLHAHHGTLLPATFYRWPSLDAPIIFAGRVPVRDGLDYGTGRRTVVCNGAVATAYQTGSGGLDGELQSWPLPAGVLTAAPPVAPRPAGLAAVVAPNPFNPAGEVVFNLPAGVNEGGAAATVLWNARRENA